MDAVTSRTGRRSRTSAAANGDARLSAGAGAQTRRGGLPAQAAPEEVFLRVEAASGLRCIIAIDSSARGPALGLCRVGTWARDADALGDALRLARAASLKAALADLPFGGAQALILAPAREVDRDALFTGFGRAAAIARGRYIAARDVGTTAADMRAAHRRSAFVAGTAGHGAFAGEPAARIAFGVATAMEEALRGLRRPLRGAKVAVQGLGAVGLRLCERLKEAGASLVVADADAARASAAGARFGARVVDVDAILREPCDVLAPCAQAGVLDMSTVTRVRAALVCGAADDPLADAQAGDALHARGILYLPDVLVNAGALIGAARDYRAPESSHDGEQDIALIGRRVHELLERSARAAPWRAIADWVHEKSQTVERHGSLPQVWPSLVAPKISGQRP